MPVSLSPETERAVLAWFRAAGVEQVETPLLQPAGPFLDVVGEDLRRRIFLTDSEKGDTLCLRPDFTVPVCLHHLKEGGARPRRYFYCGKVFRQHRAGGNEFFQAGLEDFGRADRMRADAEAMAGARDLVAKLAPTLAVRTVFGDQALFEAVVTALGLPPGWRRRMIRSFGEAGQIEPLLDELSGGAAAPDLSPEHRALAAAADVGALEARIARDMEEAGFSANASRSAREIAARLVERVRLASVRLDARALAALRRFLSLEAPLADAAACLDAFCADAGLDLGPAIAAFHERGDALAAAGADGDVTWRAAFGRTLDYYTGLVFELHGAGRETAGPLVGGGRYDGLMTLLGAGTPVPAVGFSVWLDRLENARGAA